MPVAAVWGANGFIGRHLCIALLKEGWNVVAIVRSEESLPAELRPLVAEKYIDFTSPVELIEQALQGVSVVYHCAGSTSATLQPDSFVNAIEKLIDASSAVQVKRVILISTVGVYGKSDQTTLGTDAILNGKSPYALARIKAEQALQERGEKRSVETLVIRIPMVVGVGMSSKTLELFFDSFVYGLFFHPGRKTAVLNCIGISRLSILLLPAADKELGKPVIQLADNIQWIDIAKLFTAIMSTRLVRIPLPIRLLKSLSSFFSGHATIWGKLGVFDNHVRYGDDSALLSDSGAPPTMLDIEYLVRSRKATAKNKVELRNISNLLKEVSKK